MHPLQAVVVAVISVLSKVQAGEVAPFGDEVDLHPYQLEEDDPELPTEQHQAAALQHNHSNQDREMPTSKKPLPTPSNRILVQTPLTSLSTLANEKRLPVKKLENEP